MPSPNRALLLEQNAALAWNEENPEDLIDLETMVPLPYEGTILRGACAVAMPIFADSRLGRLFAVLSL